MPIPMMVTMGTAAFLRAWRMSTTGELSPFACAVRM